MSRTNNMIRNVSFSFVGQGLGILASFIVRIVFIRILGSTYLGLDGLFSNILTILSLSELGVGTAITYSLYKPLAKKDNSKLKSLMALFKKVYTVIGLIIFGIGFALTPFLDFFINDMPDIKGLEIIYLLFVTNTAVSYFFSYKRNLILADQNRHIETIYRYGFYIAMNFLQIIYLIISRDYFGYLIIQVIMTILSNWALSRKADKMYPFLKEKNIKKLSKKEKSEIIKNTKGLMIQKVGNVVVNSTDNIIISKYVSLASVGLYSNYRLVIYALMMVINQLYTTLTPGIGNFFIDQDESRRIELFKKSNFITFWLAYFCSICLIILFNDFIYMFAGKEYIFGFSVVLIIVFNFYFTVMRKVVISFREAGGLFYKDRYRTLFEAICNLVVSIILGIKYGVFGVFLGTAISYFSLSFWIEVYVLFKDGLKSKVSFYYLDYFKKLLFTLVVGGSLYYLCSLIGGHILIKFIIKCFICVLVPNILFYIFYHKSYEFEYFRELGLGIINKVKRKVVRK
ncbi:MAG: oligosaccharide flippase family protein [Bacilli bacterium]|nr:oligosaccharide flippase family protein [Bacilli bacterium]